MSTYFYPFKAPFSSVKVETTPTHDNLGFWENGACCGWLTVSKGKGESVLWAFVDTSQHVMTVFGRAKGRLGIAYAGSLPEDTYVMSSHGKITTIRAVKNEVEANNLLVGEVPDTTQTDDKGEAP